MTELLAAVGVVAMSALLDALKAKTRVLDERIGRAIRPVQPVVVAIAGLALPYAADALGLAPISPDVFVAAPTATVLAVAAREVGEKLKRAR